VENICKTSRVRAPGCIFREKHTCVDSSGKGEEIEEENIGKWSSLKREGIVVPRERNRKYWTLRETNSQKTDGGFL